MNEILLKNLSIGKCKCITEIKMIYSISRTSFKSDINKYKTDKKLLSQIGSQW